MKGDEAVEQQEKITDKSLLCSAWHVYGEVNKDSLIQVFDSSTRCSLGNVIHEKRCLEILIEEAFIDVTVVANRNIKNTSIQRCRFV